MPRHGNQFVDERAEACDGCRDIGILAADGGPLMAWRRPLVVAGIVEQAGELGESTRQADVPELREPGAEVDLMVIDMLTEAPSARDYDRGYSPCPGVGDGPPAPVADNGTCPSEQTAELIAGQELRAGADGPCRCGSPLNEELTDLVRVLVEPTINPPDQAIKRVVIGADDHQDTR